MVVALGGLALAVVGDADGLGSLSILGLAAAVTAAFCYAIYLLAAEGEVARRPATAVVGLGMLFASVFWFVIEPPWTFPWDRLGSGVALGTLDLTADAWVVFLFISVAGTIVPFALFVGGVRRIGAVAAVTVAMLEPIVAIGAGWAALGQSMTAIQIVGAGLVLAAVTISERHRSSGALPGPGPATRPVPRPAGVPESAPSD